MSLFSEIGSSVKHLFESTIRNRRVKFMPTNTLGGGYGSGNVGYMPNGLTNIGMGGGALSPYDVDKILPDVLDNSVVAACVNAIAQALPEAPILLEQRVGKNEFRTIDSHPVLDLLHNPNPYLSEAELWGVTTAYERTRGEAFWYFEYGDTKVPKEIWFRAPEAVQVLSDTERFISGYRVTAESGAQVMLAEDDVIHFRHQLSPYNARAGWNPIVTGKRQIIGDNSAAVYHGAILRNAGAASLIIGLKDNAAADQVTPGQLQEFIAQFRRKVAGEGAGAMLGLDLPLDVHKVNFSPDEMALEKILEYYESRICALMGVNRRVINLGQDPTYENSRVALMDFWNRTIVPMRQRHASTLSSQLLPLFGLDPAKFRLRFDFSEVEAMRESTTDLHTRWLGALKEGGIDLYTFQEKIGLKPDESLRGRYVKVSKPLDSTEPAPNEDESLIEVKVWNEADHPRNLLGQFESGGGGTGSSNGVHFDDLHNWEGDLPDIETPIFQQGKAKALKALLPYTKEGSVEAGTVVVRKDGRVYPLSTGEGSEEVNVAAPQGVPVALLHTHDYDGAHSDADWATFLVHGPIEQSHVVTAHKTYSLHKPVNWNPKKLGIPQATETDTDDEVAQKLSDAENIYLNHYWDAAHQVGVGRKGWETLAADQAARAMADAHGIIYRVGTREGGANG
jgi:HK97 family phage portal protein